MGGVLINPGAGHCPDGTYDQALINMKQFIEDCEVPLELVRGHFTPDHYGRYKFIVEIYRIGFSQEYEIAMPAIPLEQVRWMDEEGQNPFDYPRLYVDGSSWLWKYGLITYANVISQYEAEIDMYQDRIQSLTQQRDGEEVTL